MRKEQNSQKQKFVLEYLISLLDDANDFFPGMQQRPAMLCSCVGWSKEKLSRNKKTTIQSQYSTETLNNSRKSASKCTKSMPCQYSNEGFVSINIHMIPKVLYTSTYVLPDLLQMVGLTHILK